jgi:predicted HD superfamily hydrolase involved in NAD metabolism
MEITQIDKMIKERLSEKRYYHCICTMEQCEILAQIYKEDVEKLKKIGLAHDIAKEMTEEEKLNYIKENHIKADNVEIENQELLHAKIGADMCRKLFGFSDDMCDAIEAHTTAKEHMTMMDKIIYVADSIGLDRKWKDVDILRQLAKEDINQAVIYMLDKTIEGRIQKKEMIKIDSILARNQLLREAKNGNKE